MRKFFFVTPSPSGGIPRKKKLYAGTKNFFLPRSCTNQEADINNSGKNHDNTPSSNRWSANNNCNHNQHNSHDDQHDNNTDNMTP